MCFTIDPVDDDARDGDEVDNENNDEEHFQIKSTEKDNNYVLVNTRIDYQYRSDLLNDMCLYDFVSLLYKKKINATDLRHLSATEENKSEETNRRGRPSNERYLFQPQHPQVTTHLLMKYSEYRVPVLYGPQIPRRDRDDTKDRYNRAILTLFVPWRDVTDICAIDQTWIQAFTFRKDRISMNSWKIIENIQLLHECKKERDEHLLQVIAEVEDDNDTIDPLLFQTNQNVHDEYDNVEDDEDFLDILGSLDDSTLLASNTTKRSTERIYIEETVEAVENVGRFSQTNGMCKYNAISKCKYNEETSILVQNQFQLNKNNDQLNRKIAPFISTTPHLARLNVRWQQQLKAEKERIRQTLIAGNYEKVDDTLDLNAAADRVVTVVNPMTYNTDRCENYGSILPVVSLATNFPTQTSIADEFTLNIEQRAAFMIITSHLDGDKRCRIGHLIPFCENNNKCRCYICR